MATAVASGTITTDGTEQTLATITTAGTYQTQVQHNALVGAADAILLRVYGKVLTGDTSLLMERHVRDGLSDLKVLVTPAMMAIFEYRVTIERIAGTDRALTWSFNSP